MMNRTIITLSVILALFAFASAQIPGGPFGPPPGTSIGPTTDLSVNTITSNGETVNGASVVNGLVTHTGEHKQYGTYRYFYNPITEAPGDRITENYYFKRDTGSYGPAVSILVGCTANSPSQVGGDYAILTGSGSSGRIQAFYINDSQNVSISSADTAGTTYKFAVNGATYVNGTFRSTGSATFDSTLSTANTATLAAAAQAVNLKLNNATSMVTNNAGRLDFAARNSAGTEGLTYAAITGGISDNTAASVDGKLELYTTYNNSLATAMSINDSQEIFFPNLDATTVTAANTTLVDTGSGNMQLCIVSSLRRLKTDIKPIVTDWNRFMRLEPVDFLEKEKGAKSPRIYGFIADDVEKVYKPLATYDAEGKLQSVAYDRVGAVNTAAIQDLKRENDELKAIIKSMDKRLKALEKKK